MNATTIPKLIAIITGLIFIPFLQGCMVIRAPILAIVAHNDCPVPPHATIVSTDLIPILLPTTSGYPQATLSIRWQGSPEDVGQFYQQELLNHGWREMEKSPEVPIPPGTYNYERGDNSLQKSLTYESLHIEVQDGKEGGTVTTLQFQWMSPLEWPGLFLRNMNNGWGEFFYQVTQNESAIIMTAPAGEVIALLF